MKSSKNCTVWLPNYGQRVKTDAHLTYERHGDTLVLRNVGRHDETLKNP